MILKDQPLLTQIKYWERTIERYDQMIAEDPNSDMGKALAIQQIKWKDLLAQLRAEYAETIGKVKK